MNEDILRSVDQQFKREYRRGFCLYCGEDVPVSHSVSLDDCFKLKLVASDCCWQNATITKSGLMQTARRLRKWIISQKPQVATIRSLPTYLRNDAIATLLANYSDDELDRIFNLFGVSTIGLNLKPEWKR